MDSTKFLYVYNKLFSSFVKTLKDLSNDLKTIIKKHYKVIDKSSNQYIEKFWSSVSPQWKELVDVATLWDAEHLQDVEVANELSLSVINKYLKEEDKENVSSHINLLLIFAYLYQDYTNESNKSTESTESTENTNGNDQGENALNALFEKVVELLSLKQNNKTDTDAYKDKLDSIVDDDITRLLSKVTIVSNTVPKDFDHQPQVEGNPLEFLQGLENSKIASLAKEITSEIDLSNLHIDKPEDISKLMDMSDGNNFLGNIVSKVSNKLTEKLNTGELKQEDLMNEAMSVMGALNNGDGLGGLLKNMGGLGGLGGLSGLGDLMSNPMMAEMLKMAKKGKVQSKNTNGARKSSGMSTRDRLKKKLDERKKASTSQENK
jgi:SHS2 domain-containing protein